MHNYISFHEPTYDLKEIFPLYVGWSPVELSTRRRKACTRRRKACVINQNKNYARGWCCSTTVHLTGQATRNAQHNVTVLSPVYKCIPKFRVFRTLASRQDAVHERERHSFLLHAAPRPRKVTDIFLENMRENAVFWRLQKYVVMMQINLGTCRYVRPVLHQERRREIKFVSGYDCVPF
jgi:hypothetical protein